MKPGRNDPCDCGSGKKFKHCCEGKAASHTPMPSSAEINPLIALFNTGRYTELENRAGALVGQYPDFGFGWKLLGGALQMQGKNALPAFQKTAELMPGEADAHYNLGVALKSFGLLADAAASYRRGLQLNPDYAEAHGNLGNVLKDLGQLDEAVACYRRAVQLKPDSAETHNNLGIALKDLGQLDAAVASYRRALQLKPDHAEAHYNLGNALVALGQLDEAVASYRRAVQIKPDFTDAHSNLASALKDLGQLDDTVESYRRAVELRPASAEAHNNLGTALKDLGQFEGAVASYRRALQLKPDYAEAHYNLGNALKDLEQFDTAAESYRRALYFKPDFADAYSNLGAVLKDFGQYESALENYRRAVELNPVSAEAHFNMGVVLIDLGQFDDAAASYLRALKIEPDFSEAYNNLGNALKDLGRLDDAVTNYRKALKIKPDYAEAQTNLGSALKDIGQYEGALESYRRALEIKPDFAGAHSNLLFCLSHSEIMDAQALFAEHCRFGEQFEAPLRAGWPRHTNSRDPARVLQIGFVSGDLHNHAVASFIEPVLAQLAGYPQLALHAYYNHTIDDSATRRLRGYFKHWHPIVGLSDEALAQQIRADGIDVLIDLSGHTGKNRLLTFARKPAPVQASWIGYPGTTGLHAMDYYLADRFFLPHEQFASQFTEKFAYLPANAPFLPSPAAPPVNALPALGNGYLTLGSFNRSSKISRSVVALWARLLRALPDSRILLAGMPEAGKYDTLIEWFAQEGIARERLDFHARSGMDRYLGLHQQVDLCLDTFPYNGGTTTLHALWMGVPTLTLTGHTAAGRQGASILGHAGLEAFAAHDAEDFVRRGLSWAGDLAALSVVRSGLRERFAKSAMGQPALVAAGLQQALRIIWQRWCESLPPADIDVSGNPANHEARPLENETGGNPRKQGR